MSVRMITEELSKPEVLDRDIEIHSKQDRTEGSSEALRAEAFKRLVKDTTEGLEKERSKELRAKLIRLRLEQVIDEVSGGADLEDAVNRMLSDVSEWPKSERSSLEAFSR